MAEAKYISQDKLGKWLDELSQQMQVLAPVQEGEAVVFRPYQTGTEIRLEGQPTLPPKEAVFPASEELFAYTYRKNPEDAAQTDVEIGPRTQPQKTLVFGARPCGSRGFVIFDPVYTQGYYMDPYYRVRRESTIFASVACVSHENSCFCHSVGSGPGDTAGSDILLTPVDQGYVAEAVTDKGGEMLGSSLLEAAGDKAGKARELRDKALKDMGEPRDFTAAREKLLAIFDDLDFWEDVSAKCISCGACTYLCPTCYCFNITDESAGMQGSRIRSWDNCMSFQFTLEASGHNPRPTKAHRLRNRVGHKFSYYPELHQGMIACCGCGRCIKHCPVSVDIREIVIRAMEHQTETGEEAGK